MFRNSPTWGAARAVVSAGPPAAAALALLALVFPAAAQQAERRNRIDVQDYAIDAEISPNTQNLTAKATVRFLPVDDGVTSATFELNNALNVSRVVDAAGKQIQA